MASVMQHRQSTETNSNSEQPETPASYTSSMEMAPYKPALAPTSSRGYKGRTGKSTYSLRTSTELLKVLNRILSLEEQNESNISLMKSLKRELDLSNTQMKQLLQEKKRDRQEINDLKKQVAEKKIGTKSKEKDQTEDGIQNGLEDERRLRKHSENLQRKLDQELSEVKSSLSNALKEVKRERKARILLEELCDEFAKGIRDYEQEVRFLKHSPGKDHVVREQSDRLILHISESWLDERTQMKLAQARDHHAKKKTVLDKLGSEIETFLQARKSGNAENSVLSLREQKGSSLRRQSLESYNEKGALSAPPNENNHDESAGQLPQKFEANAVTQDGSESKRKLVDTGSYLLNNMIRDPSSLSEGKKIQEAHNYTEDSFDKQKQTSRLRLPDQGSKSSSRRPKDASRTTLKAKLLEARLESQLARSGASKGLSTTKI